MALEFIVFKLTIWNLLTNPLYYGKTFIAINILSGPLAFLLYSTTYFIESQILLTIA